MKQLAYFSHPAFLQHYTGAGHPESPDRLSILDRTISDASRRENDPLFNTLLPLQAESHPELDRWIGEIHSNQYTQQLRQSLPASGLFYLDADTVLSPKSLWAAELAVSAVLSAVDRVMGGEVRRAFCALRPPGHHAEREHGMGFCLFNQVAIAARYVQKKYGLQKVCIIDFDVHHGNGTQNAFYDDPTVFYFSTHQFPCYPGSGLSSETGEGLGRGTTFNAPLKSGAANDAFVRPYEIDLVAALGRFKPDFILISAGFDAHLDDPLADCCVTSSGFARVTQIIRALSEEYCQGRIVSCLEGGYDLKALARSVHEHLFALASP